MTYEALISPHFERPEAALLLGSFEPFFHMPSPEGNSQHFLDRRVFRSVADAPYGPKSYALPAKKTTGQPATRSVIPSSHFH